AERFQLGSSDRVRPDSRRTGRDNPGGPDGPAGQARSELTLALPAVAVRRAGRQSTAGPRVGAGDPALVLHLRDRLPDHEARPGRRRVAHGPGGWPRRWLGALPGPGASGTGCERADLGYAAQDARPPDAPNRRAAGSRPGAA